MKRGRGRPPVGTVIEKKPVALHWVRVASMFANTTLCGQPLTSVKVPDEFADVTCKQCRRLGERDPSHQRKPDKLDSLMMRAFAGNEEQLNALCTNARKAIADWEASRPPVLGIIGRSAENMADTLRGFLTALGRSD